MSERRPSNLLQSLINGTVSSGMDVAEALRIAKVLAYELDSEPFKEWVDNELSGYSAHKDIPKYRRFRVQPRGDFFDDYNAHYNTPIPLSIFPKATRDWVSRLNIIEGVGVLEREIQHHAADTVLRESLDFEPIPQMIQSGIPNLTLVEAWKPVFVAPMYTSIVDQVRNRLLSFSLELQSLDTDDADSSAGDRRIHHQQVTQIFSTTINTSMAHVALGSSELIQADQVIVQGNIESLKDYLTLHGVSDDDIAKLHKAIVTDETSSADNGRGPDVRTWREMMLEKASTGAWNITLNAAGEILAQAISAYYGMPH